MSLANTNTKLIEILANSKYMTFSDWPDYFSGALADMWGGVLNLVPKLLAAIVIFIIGWAFGVILGSVVAQIIKALKIDELLRSVGLETVLSKGGFKLNTGAFIGALVKWFVIIVFLIASVEILGLNQVNEFLVSVLNYLPNIFVASIILVLAALIADAVHKVVVGSAKAASVPSAHFMGGVARWAIWIFAIFAALDKLLVSDLFGVLFQAIVYALALGAALAFGLGGRDAAAKYLERLRNEISE